MSLRRILSRLERPKEAYKEFKRGVQIGSEEERKNQVWRSLKNHLLDQVVEIEINNFCLMYGNSRFKLHEAGCIHSFVLGP